MDALTANIRTAMNEIKHTDGTFGPLPKRVTAEELEMQCVWALNNLLDVWVLQWGDAPTNPHCIIENRPVVLNATGDERRVSDVLINDHEKMKKRNGKALKKEFPNVKQPNVQFDVILRILELTSAI